VKEEEDEDIERERREKEEFNKHATVRLHQLLDAIIDFTDQVWTTSKPSSMIAFVFVLTVSCGT
jgi:hypothetical protein